MEHRMKQRIPSFDGKFNTSGDPFEVDGSEIELALGK